MCIDDQLLSSYLDGELQEPFRSQVEEHIGYCQACAERLEEMRRQSASLKDAAFGREALEGNKDKIWSKLDSKFFSEDGKRSRFRRKVELSLPGFITAAAAVVFIFVGSFILFGSSDQQTDELLPSFSVHADAGNVQFVSQKADSLDNYTLEEILSYLDSKGYDVDISIKGLSPIEEPQD